LDKISLGSLPLSSLSSGTNQSNGTKTSTSCLSSQVVSVVTSCPFSQRLSKGLTAYSIALHLASPSIFSCLSLQLHLPSSAKPLVLSGQDKQSVSPVPLQALQE